MTRALHGGAVWEVIQGDLQKFPTFITADVNDAWYPPAPEVLESLRMALQYIQVAPDTWADNLREHIASHYHLPPELVVLDGGASSLLHRCLTAVISPGTEVIIPRPSYAEYSAISSKCGGTVNGGEKMCQIAAQ